MENKQCGIYVPWPEIKTINLLLCDCTIMWNGDDIMYCSVDQNTQDSQNLVVFFLCIINRVTI